MMNEIKKAKLDRKISKINNSNDLMNKKLKMIDLKKQN